MSAATRVGIALLTAGAALIGGAYAAAVVGGGAPTWAPWCVALGASAVSVSLFVLGAASRGPVSRGVALLLAALFVVLAGSFAAALALPAAGSAADPLLLGLPRPLGIVFYGIGFIPLVVLPVVFARTFRSPR